ncbi:hypothetical protein [Dyella acidiphila]|uniref:Uncharacterized protein n=1 Tax=Dyella acidiphila TaxID=2775866 RepID=A0ABR9GCJ3_9GAMM|nr:hypothetical protein [Dyella acidiphila]MBE1161762.1 hypothetical protein [Dyella acidiphila]
MTSFLADFRKRINRDDGKYFQVGNRPLHWLEIVGLLLTVAAIALWQLHVKASLNMLWALFTGITGLLLTVLGDTLGRRRP